MRITPSYHYPCVLFLSCLLALAANAQEIVWRSVYLDQTWPTAEEACQLGEAEGRISALGSNNHRYVPNPPNVSIYLPDEEASCRFTVERLFFGFWVTHEIVSQILFAEPGCTYTTDSGGCISPSAPPNSGNPGCSLGVGNPINLATGNKYQREDDYESNRAGMPLMIVRHYNSNNTHSGIFGSHWASAFDSRLYINSKNTQAIVIRDDGKGENFTLNAGSWSSSNREGAILEAPSGGGWRYEDRHGMEYHFNVDGQLLSKTNANGYRWTLAYSNGRLASVTDHHGATFTFTFNGDRVTRITTAIGNFDYEYSDGFLSAVVFPDDTPSDQSDNQRRTYQYTNTNHPHALTAITDENNQRYVAWTYDAAGRATSSRYYATGDTEVDVNTLDYTHINDAADPRIRVINPLGKNAVYHLANIRDVQQIVRVEGEASTNCPAFSRYRSYSSSGNLMTVTDDNGNVTRYEHDTRGRVIRETRGLKWDGSPQYGVDVDTALLLTTAVTQVTETCWHATHSLPERIIDAHRVTFFTYNSAGRLLSRVEEERNASNERCP